MAAKVPPFRGERKSLLPKRVMSNRAEGPHFAFSTIYELGVETFLLSPLAAWERNKYRNAVRLLMPSSLAIAADDSPPSFSSRAFSRFAFVVPCFRPL